MDLRHVNTVKAIKLHQGDGTTVHLSEQKGGGPDGRCRLSDDGVSGKKGVENTASQPAQRARLRCGRTAVGRVPRARDRAARYEAHWKRDARGFLVPKDRRGDDRALLGMDFPSHTSPFPKGPCIAMVLSKVKIKTRKINTLSNNKELILFPP